MKCPFCNTGNVNAIGGKSGIGFTHCDNKQCFANKESEPIEKGRYVLQSRKGFEDGVGIINYGDKMKIKEGYNGKILEIRINGRLNDTAELWLEQHILSNEEGNSSREALSYITLQELADLKKEIEAAILKIVGIER